jgi:hypothetical protein
MIEQLRWRPHNIAKLREREISPEEVSELALQGLYTVDVHADYPTQVRITGYTAAGRWLTIALEDLGGGVFRPGTGWMATEDEIRAHFQGG